MRHVGSFWSRFWSAAITLLMLAVPLASAQTNSIAFSSAEIDFTGSELTLTFQNNSVPTEVRVARSYGIPTLKRGSTTLRVIWSSCDWEIDRGSSPKLILRARYRIHDDDRATITQTGFTVTVGSIIRDDAPTPNVNGTVTTATTVENRSEVNAGGWRDHYSEADNYTTIYVDAQKGDDNQNGQTPSTAKRTLDAAWTTFNGLSNQTAHQLLFARGRTYVGQPQAYPLTIGGADRKQKLYIGSYLPTGETDSNQRPRLIMGSITMQRYTHIDGIEWIRHPGIDQESGNARSLSVPFGSNREIYPDTSVQDCVFDPVWNIEAQIIDRCILVGIPTHNPTQIARDTTGAGPTTAAAVTYYWSNTHWVGKQFPKIGHGAYEVGTDNPGTGTRSHMWNLLLVSNYLQDMHRSRAEQQYCSLYRVIQDYGGAGPVMGVDQGWSFLGSNTWVPGTPTGYIEVPRSVFSGGDPAPPNNTYFTGIKPGAYVRILEGVANPPQFYAIEVEPPTPGPERTHVVYHAGSDKWRIYLSDSIGITGVAVKGRTGQTPCRARNQTYRHILNFNPANIFIERDGQAMGAGEPRDMAGYWQYDTLAVQTDSAGNSYPIGANRTGDDKRDLLDFNVENITFARVANNGIRLGATSASPVALLRRCLVDSTSSSSSAWVLGYWEVDQPFVDTLGEMDDVWACNHNVYYIPDAAAFSWPPTIYPLSATSPNPSWRSLTGLDANSVAVTGAQATFNGDSTAAYHPDLSTYVTDAGLAGGGPWWLPYSGGRLQAALAEILRNRPYRTWDKRLDAEQILRWALKEYKPTEGTWPSSGQNWWVGFADYKLEPPTNPGATAGISSVVVNWTAPSGADQTRVTRYIVRFGTNSTGPLQSERDFWNTTSGTITGLTPGQLYYFEVHSSDGWNESGPSQPRVSATPNPPP
jgi:hypothetical protein